MSFPEFEQERKRLLFFSRGRGRGHAIPDVEILKSLAVVDPAVEVRVVSYGLGADTFNHFGYPVVDLGMPDESPIAEISVLAGRLIRWLHPDVVVAHEEFAVMPAAKIFDLRTIFITDFFTDADSYGMHALTFADEILFLGEAGVFEPPSWLRERTYYVGRLLRAFKYAAADKHKARAELALEAGEFVLLVLPGSWPERETPLVDLLRKACSLLTDRRVKIIWLATLDREEVERELSGLNVSVLEHYWEIDRLMVACDVAITKSNRVTVFELESLGVPAISTSWGLSEIDDRAVSTIDPASLYRADELTPECLAEAIRAAAMQMRTPVVRKRQEAPETCARRIADAFPKE